MSSSSLHSATTMAMVALLLPFAAVAAQDTSAYRAAGNAPSRSELIEMALSAAPDSIAKNAAVAAPDSAGTMTALRSGTNGFTCIPDDPQSPGKDPMCLNASGMKWVQALMSGQPKPDVDEPGIAYMLQGGSDISATNPFARHGQGTEYVESPPHYMILWPFDPAETGLSTTPKKTGTWIMWSGTPYAHLMVNQEP